MSSAIRVQVKCYSGYKADERPESFVVGDKDIRIMGILERWFEPGFSFFRVRTDDEREYVLNHDQNRDQWQATWSHLLK